MLVRKRGDEAPVSPQVVDLSRPKRDYEQEEDEEGEDEAENQQSSFSALGPDGFGRSNNGYGGAFTTVTAKTAVESRQQHQAPLSRSPLGGSSGSSRLVPRIQESGPERPGSSSGSCRPLGHHSPGPLQIRRLTPSIESELSQYASRGAELQRQAATANKQAQMQQMHHRDSKKFDIDLRDWIGHRVLARRDRYFCPGVIQRVYEGYSVSILFDGEEQPLVYHEVLAKGELDTVISDSVPATNQVGLSLFYHICASYIFIS